MTSFQFIKKVRISFNVCFIDMISKIISHVFGGSLIEFISALSASVKSISS